MRFYSEFYAPQPALVDLKGHHCRGGFSTGGLIGFLYARGFPKEEWKKRVREAWDGMENL